ncbi:MAG: high frequency lysogenization protein HflD [Chromatiales bacterium]|nr:high frequency lysogenization protein HflD [Chromatiales bacterium]
MTEGQAVAPASPLTQRVLAVAGIFQAARLVRDVARDGRCDSVALRVCMESVLRIDQPVEQVLDSPARLRLGLETVLRQLAREGGAPEAEITRYGASLMHLERRLARRDDLRDVLRDGLEVAIRQAEQFGPDHVNVVANLGDLYTRTISLCGPRILVRGDPRVLADRAHAERIRALLLAGMRATVLWRRVGGSRPWLLLRRGSVVECARELLATSA